MKSKSRVRILRAFASGALLFTTAHHVLADVRLPALFSDHMVLQQDAAVPIWGWADPGEQVKVAFAGQTKSVKAGPDGRWKVKLKKLKASATPQELEVTGKNRLSVKDVLVGEVWLGSGQSNMAMPVREAKDAEQECKAASWPQIRMFTVTSKSSETAQDDCEGKWEICSPETVGDFSATAYYFGRELHQALHRPVGLIHSSVGGSPIESWIDSGKQYQVPQLKRFLSAQKAAEDKITETKKAEYEKALAEWNEASDKATAANATPPPKPRDPLVWQYWKTDVGGLFNGKIAPLVPYAMRGMIWYQGESNAPTNKAGLYQYQLPLLIQEWRTRWGYEFPFASVQLPNFVRDEVNWMLVREVSLKTLALPKTGMAITIDIGDPNNIHPANKQEVGRRLSLWALVEVYGQKGLASSGPLPAKHTIRGSEVAISFTHTDGGLVAKGGNLKGFTLAGADRKWLEATAAIQGNKVLVSSSEIKTPIAVRYAWSNNPDCNLYNGAGLPASPFRTDDWQE